MFDDIFRKDNKYKVLFSCKSGIDDFNEAEVLIFDQALYSPYDAAYAFKFMRDNGDALTWWVNEDASPNEWTRFFQPLP